MDFYSYDKRSQPEPQVDQPSFSGVSSPNEPNDDDLDIATLSMPEGMLVGTAGHTAGIWLGRRYFQGSEGQQVVVVGGDGKAPEVEEIAGDKANGPEKRGFEVSVGGTEDVGGEKEPAIEEQEPAQAQDEQDPDGMLYIADFETAQGSIMRPPLPSSSGEIPYILLYDTANTSASGSEGDVEAAAVVRTTRTRVSKLPYGTSTVTPKTTSTTKKLTTSTNTKITTKAAAKTTSKRPLTTTKQSSSSPTSLPISQDMRCGTGYGTACQSGLCCSQYSWCGVTGAHCATGCQAGFGRCNATAGSDSSSGTGSGSGSSSGNQIPVVVVPPSPPTPPSPPPPASSQKGAGTVAYFPNWSRTPLTSYDLSGVNVINYAFVEMRPDGSLATMGDYSSGGLMYTLNKVMKDRYPGLRTVFSIGGWTWSQWFSVVAADPNRRARFADAIAKFIEDNRFSGCDLDWEYPTGGGLEGNTASWEDSRNFVLMVQAIRNRIGWSKLITIAASADTGKYGAYLKDLASYLDWINLVS